MIENLTKLRELLNKDRLKLKGMPRGIGKLVSLRRLPIFVINKQDRVEHCASISELEHLNNLVGELEIYGLKNVTNPADAKAANLIKKNLQSLKLRWNVLSAAEDTDTVQPAEEMDAVLENLQPHQNLEKLEIEGYAGGKFPGWMMNRIDSYLPNLVKIKLVNIPRCSSLPPLGLLPVLEELIIRDMPTITNLGVEFDGDSHINESANKFPALRSHELCLPSSVQELKISGISKECLSLILKRPTMDSETPPDDGDAVSLQQPNMGLRRLKIKKCQQLTCLPEGLRSFMSLKWLKIKNCEDLERIEDWLGELTKLTYLGICWCSSLRYLPTHKMTTLETLEIIDCPLLFNADGQFVDTNVDHIRDVFVNFSVYKYEKRVSNSSEYDRSSRCARQLDW